MSEVFSWDLIGSSVSGATSSEATSGNAIPVVRDISVDVQTGDWVLVNGDFTLTFEASAIQQDLAIRLRMFLGEWFEDEDIGIPYFQQIFTKATSLDLTRSIFREKILETPGVKSINNITFNLDPRTRELDVDFRVDTDFGELRLNLPVET